MSLLGGLRYFTSSVFKVHALDDTDGDGLSHITDSETTQRRELLEGFHAHGFAGHQANDGSVSRLDGLGVLLSGLAGTTVALLLDLGELAGDMSRVAIEDGRVAVADLSGMVEYDDLGGEVGSATWWGRLGVTGYVATTQFLNGYVLDVETNVVAGNGLLEGFVVHLHGLYFSGQTSWGEHDDHTGLQHTGLNSADWYRSNTSNFVDIL